MYKTVILSSIFLLFTFITHADGIEFEHLTLKEALEKSEKENKPIFIDIYATWCAPCKYLSKNIFPDKELGEFFNEHFINIKLDGELEDGESLMIDFELTSFPTMLFINSDKVLLKKIVGAESAEVILKTGKGIIFPEETEVYQMTQRFNNGERERAFLASYVSVLFEEDQDYEEVLSIFNSQNKELNLTDENEFLIFCLGTDDLEDKNIIEFLSGIETYYELFPGYCEGKIKLLLFNLVTVSNEKEDLSIINDGVSQIYPAFQTVFADDYTENDLIEMLVEMREE